MSFAKETIPEAIRRQLPNERFSPYEIPTRTGHPWVFDISSLRPVEQSVVTDAVKIFNGSQRWSAEAVSAGRGVNNEADIRGVYCIDIAFRAHSETPIRTMGHLFGKRKYLDLANTFTSAIPPLSEWWNGNRGHSLDLTNRGGVLVNNRLGPFGLEGNIARGLTPYYISDLRLEPFLFYYKAEDEDNNDYPLDIDDEDLSRLIMRISLQDSRDRVKYKIELTVKDFESGNEAARNDVENASRRLEQVRAELEVAQIVLQRREAYNLANLAIKERLFLERLEAREDPFR